MPEINILVVDDEKVVGIGFQRELSEASYNVDTVLSGEEAVKAVGKKRYDIVFIDKVMPGIDGIETCREIMKIRPDSICIFMTGRFDKESSIKEAQFMAAGGKTYYLYKPFASGEILDVVKKALKDNRGIEE